MNLSSTWTEFDYCQAMKVDGGLATVQPSPKLVTTTSLFRLGTH